MDQRKMMGFDIPGDQRVAVPVRDWNAMKLALWRNKTAWEIVSREANSLLSGCRHVETCEGARDENRPCVSDLYEKASQGEQETDEEFAARPGVRIREGCLDRELRMSALVILNAARAFTTIRTPRPANEPYFAPGREYFSEILSELGVAQVEIELLRAALRDAGLPIPQPPPVTPAVMASAEKPPQLEEPQPHLEESP